MSDDLFREQIPTQGKENVVMHCKASFNVGSKKGESFLSIDFEDGRSFEFKTVFEKIPSNNYLEYLTLCLAIAVKNQYNFSATIYSSSELVVYQISGIYRLKQLEFEPFHDFITKNLENTSLQVKRSKDMKFSKQSLRDIPAGLRWEVDNLMAESLAKSLRQPFAGEPDLRRETIVRKKMENINNSKYAKRSAHELTLSEDVDYELRKRSDYEA